MLKILEQTELMEKIAQILHEEAAEEYHSVSCDFEPFGDGDEETMITSFHLGIVDKA